MDNLTVRERLDASGIYWSPRNEARVTGSANPFNKNGKLKPTTIRLLTRLAMSTFVVEGGYCVSDFIQAGSIYSVYPHRNRESAKCILEYGLVGQGYMKITPTKQTQVCPSVLNDDGSTYSYSYRAYGFEVYHTDLGLMRKVVPNIVELAKARSKELQRLIDMGFEKKNLVMLLTVMTPWAVRRFVTHEQVVNILTLIEEYNTRRRHMFTHDTMDQYEEVVLNSRNELEARLAHMEEAEREADRLHAERIRERALSLGEATKKVRYTYSYSDKLKALVGPDIVLPATEEEMIQRGNDHHNCIGSYIADVAIVHGTKDKRVKLIMWNDKVSWEFNCSWKNGVSVVTLIQIKAKYNATVTDEDTLKMVKELRWNIQALIQEDGIDNLCSREEVAI